MRCTCTLRHAISASLLVLFSSTAASAAIVTPGDTVPGISGDVFGWSESDTHSSFANWSNFSSGAGGTTLPAIGPGGPPLATETFADGGSASDLSFNSFATIISRGRAYGFNFGDTMRPFQPEFVHDAFATVRSGTSGGDNTRIVAQWQTTGTELDYDSILLSPTIADEGMIAPTLAVETSRGLTAGTGFPSEQVSYMAIWDLDDSQAEYRVDFSAQGNHSVLEGFRVDTFTQPTTFASVTAVPEPGSLAVVGIVAGSVSLRRRWERSSNHAGSRK